MESTYWFRRRQFQWAVVYGFGGGLFSPQAVVVWFRPGSVGLVVSHATQRRDSTTRCFHTRYPSRRHQEKLQTEKPLPRRASTEAERSPDPCFGQKLRATRVPGVVHPSKDPHPDLELEHVSRARRMRARSTCEAVLPGPFQPGEWTGQDVWYPHPPQGVRRRGAPRAHRWPRSSG